MGASADTLNYFNPFYWFLFLYIRPYRSLAAGCSRSREFLADRMAASQYGPGVFTSALTNVSTDGTLFEMAMYGNVNQLVEVNKSFANLYDAYRFFRDKQIDRKDRDELYQMLLDEKGSLFASPPHVQGTH
jgi:Zn-dependent protease with chaperone function